MNYFVCSWLKSSRQSKKLKIAEFAAAYGRKAEVPGVAVHEAANDPFRTLKLNPDMQQ